VLSGLSNQPITQVKAVCPKGSDATLTFSQVAKTMPSSALPASLVGGKRHLLQVTTSAPLAVASDASAPAVVAGAQQAPSNVVTSSLFLAPSTSNTPADQAGPAVQATAGKQQAQGLLLL
jgi:hypothetical protein